MAGTDESTAISHVIQRLTASFDEIPAEQVSAAVDDALARFEQSPIREFVPLFVERRVRDQLAHS
ncbi:three-helix bundle dimerization domain-containing protein [Mycobacterium sp. C31M]